MTAEADGTFTFHSPVGKSFAPQPPRESVDNAMAWLHEWAEERDLELGPEVNMPLWDGKKPDYDWAVGVLLDAG